MIRSHNKGQGLAAAWCEAEDRNRGWMNPNMADVLTLPQRLEQRRVREDGRAGSGAEPAAQAKDSLNLVHDPVAVRRSTIHLLAEDEVRVEGCQQLVSTPPLGGVTSTVAFEVPAQDCHMLAHAFTFEERRESSSRRP